MYIINKAVTRLNPITGIGTLLDHLVLSSLDKHSENHIALTSKRINVMSDHNFIILMLRVDSKPTLRDRIVKIKRTNLDLITKRFYDELLIINPDTASLNVQSVDVYFNIIHKSLSKVVKQCTKFTKVKLPETLRTLPNWADDKYIAMLNTLYNLEEKILIRKANGLKFDQLQIKFNELNDIRDRYASVKAKIYYRSLEIDNIYDAWKIINDLIGRSRKNDNSSNLVLEDENGNLLCESHEIVEAFQEKFLKIVGAKNSCNVSSHKYLGPCVSNSFVFEETTPQEIFTIIGALATNKSPGYDDVSASVLKRCNEGLCAHLANIFNLMIRSGKYPDGLKLSAVKPIPKSGKMLSLDNCRPISLLPLIDKVFENILCSQLNKFLEDNSVLNKLQYGFRSRRGCPDALCMILNHVSKLLNSGKGVIIMSFDIQKAFDTVCHKVLLRKLNFVGVRGEAYDLIKSFLTDRKQFVKLNFVCSKCGKVFLGVPQGANLGPLLFNILINDLSSLNTYSTLYMYADDVVAVFPVDPANNPLDIQRLDNDIQLLKGYYENNHLKINCDKSQFIILGSCAQNIKDLLTGKQIKETSCLKYLGVLIDSDLKMLNQVDKICTSLAQGINALRFLKQNLTQQSLLKFFHGHLQSHISYCAFSLLRCRSIDIERIQRLQSKALKIILDLPDMHPTLDLFTKNAKQIMCVVGLIYYSALIMVKKCVLCKDESLPCINRARSTRRKDLILSIAKKKVMSDDITNIGCKLFNELPADIKSENNLLLFKLQLRKFILSRNVSLIKHGQFSNKSFNL